jgi:REP element-mobilizing transposase RayT
MRRARITYEGAFHHVTNRGINGEDIFTGNQYKSQFLDFLSEKSQKLKLRIFAYCIMTNHYHIILENTTGKMSELLKQLNGQYGMYYRKRSGGKGYVFQGRYKSTLIQDDSYLRLAIGYTLLNPLRAGMVKEIDEYIWSSLNCYFKPLTQQHNSDSNSDSGTEEEIVETKFVEELFDSKDQLIRFLSEQVGKEIPEVKTRYGYILGSKEFIAEAIKKYDRREKENGYYLENKRIEDKDKYLEPVEKVLWEFEIIKGIKVEDIDVRSWKGKRLRGELLVHLKDRTALTYPEIIKLDIFNDLQCSSLTSIYRNSKKRLYNIL